MSNYKERLTEVMGILQEAGARLYKANKILGYSIITDSLHSTITNDPQGDWNEYPCAHAIFKFGRLENPKYLYTKAEIRKSSNKEKVAFGFGLSHPKISGTLPKIGGLEEKTENYFGYCGYYTNAVAVASYVTSAIEKHKKTK